MNIECQYNGSTVSIVAVNPNPYTGHIDIVYVDSNSDLKIETIEMQALLATGSTIFESDYKNNFTATVAPTATNDVDEGYEVGSHWINLTTDIAYICVDNTVNTAVWQPAGVPSPLIFKGSIAAAGDFPNEADVIVGWFYLITANVTDNQAGKTATGQSFIDGDEIIWNGASWTAIQASAWSDDGTNVSTTRNVTLNSISSNDATKPFILNTTTLATDGVLIGNKTPIGTWAGDGVSSAGTANITDVGGAAHGLSLAAGDLVHISNCTTASHKGFYRIVTAGATTVVVDRVLAATDTDLTVTFYKDVIYVGATDGTNGQRIMNYSHQDKPLQIGGDVLAATLHSLGSEDVLIGGVLEINRATYFDGAIYNASHVNVDGSGGARVSYLTNSYPFIQGTTTGGQTDTLLLVAGSTDRAFVFCGAFSGKDWDRGAQTNPKIFVFSNVSPDVSNNQWGSFSHDQEDFVITTGDNTGAGSAPTTDENGIKLFPRSGSAGLHVKGLGELHATRAAITVGSGAGITVNVTGDLNRQLYKVTTTYAAYTDADTTKGIVIATLPAKMKIVGFYADTTTPYTGGATNAATMVVGITAESAAEIIASHNVFAGAVTSGLADADMGTSMTRAAAIQGGYMPSWTGTTAIYATLVIVNDILSNLTAGSTTFYIETEQF